MQVQITFSGRSVAGQWQEGEPCKINLSKIDLLRSRSTPGTVSRISNLVSEIAVGEIAVGEIAVGEIADTPLASDLDEQKHLYERLYEALSIPGYWVIDTQSKRVFAFQLQHERYQLIEQSQILSEQLISVLNTAID